MQWKQVVLALCFCSAVLGVAQSLPVPPMTHEEVVVRTTYARLSFAVQIEEIYKITHDAASSGKKIDRGEFATRLKTAELKFELSEFKVGDLSDIAKTTYSNLVTKPEGGAALDVHAGTWEFASDEPRVTHSSVATVRWHQQQNISENWDQPFGAVYTQTEVAGQHSRFAAFKVKANFQGRSIEYHALFLFGKDKAGQETVLPVDTVTNLSGSSLNLFLKVPAYPETLIEGGLGKDPVIYDWLADNQVAQATGKRHEANCDLVTLRCGVHSEDLKKITRSETRIRRVPKLAKPHLVDASFHFAATNFRPLLQASGDCTQFNNITAATSLAQANNLNHVSGNHVFTTTKSTSCTYSNGSNSNGLCNTSCSTAITAIWDESGVVSSSCHQNGTDLKEGSANGTGAGANCTGGAGGGVKACLFCQCSVTVSVTVSGTTVTATSDGFFTAQDQISNNCAAQTQPAPPPPPPPAPTPTPTTCGLPTGDPSDPSSDLQSTGSGDTSDCSPIVVDTSGQGFFLTDAAGGVKFDIAGTGVPIQIAWTANSRNAFLVLDRNGNGAIDNGTELFGNFTPQPQSQRPNGFLALAEYDKPENGGNGDGIIDAHDAIWPKLRLWVDANHDGISQPEELHSLEEMGVFNIGLDYSLSMRTDEFGNVFRYRAKINQSIRGPAEAEKQIYDVFFVSK